MCICVYVYIYVYIYIYEYALICIDMCIGCLAMAGWPARDAQRTPLQHILLTHASSYQHVARATTSVSGVGKANTHHRVCAHIDTRRHPLVNP